MICQWERTMDEMLQVWAMTFDRSPQPFGVAEVLLDAPTMRPTATSIRPWRR